MRSSRARCVCVMQSMRVMLLAVLACSVMHSYHLLHRHYTYGITPIITHWGWCNGGVTALHHQRGVTPSVTLSVKLRCGCCRHGCRRLLVARARHDHRERPKGLRAARASRSAASATMRSTSAACESGQGESNHKRLSALVPVERFGRRHRARHESPPVKCE